MHRKTLGGIAAAAVLCLSLGYAQDKPHGPTTGKQQGDSRASEGKSMLEAERELFGDGASADFAEGYTSHFNFDNRRLGTNPPTTNKYRCLLECKLENGQTRWYTSNDLRTVRVGELDTLDLNTFKVRVVAVRFWWKLRPLGDWFASVWGKARPDHYIVYAFLVWKGYNDHEAPDVYDEPIADAVSRAEGAKQGPGSTAKQP